MDGNFYNLLSKTFINYGNMEFEISATVKECASKVTAEASKITREKDMELFAKEYASSFVDTSAFVFEASGTDEETNICVDELTKISLGQTMGQLIARDNMLDISQAALETENIGLQTLVTAYTETPSFGSISSPIEKQLELVNQIDFIKAQRNSLKVQIAKLESLNSNFF